ncbi:unnamed protein product [Auanema sp. JU1783]|nr:unnamed protein product [Auanema sp. JU1783]
MSREYKTFSVIHCALASLTSFILCAGSTPVIITPCSGGYTEGFMNSLGFTTLSQLCIPICLINYMTGANVMLFYIRYNALKTGGNLFRFRLFRIISFILWIIFYSVLLTSLSLNAQIENQKQSKQDCLAKFEGDITEVIQKKTIIVLFTGTGLSCSLLLYGTLGQIVNYTSHIIIFALFTRRGLLEIRTHMSIYTLKRHSFFIRVLYTETIVHAVSFAFPAISFFLIPFMDIRIPETQNACVTLIAMSGIIGPVYVFYKKKTLLPIRAIRKRKI